MTTIEFRRNNVYTSAMRVVLNDPIVQLALETLRDSNPPIDPDPIADGIASVRTLSQMVGYTEYSRQLRLLAEPVQQPVQLTAEFKPEDE